ncbi:DUF2232 domain-containing protein [Aneurinibacillus terranovensis]|uniref:YybS family protein n=1 Tax=Aneurinibacillus terranovensis TaxID=278991 RepID=UPI00048001C1
MRNNVRELLEGAFMSAVFLILFLLTFYTPLGIASVFVLPVPLTLYAYRHSGKGRLVTFLAVMFLSFIFTSFSGVTLALPAAVLGLVMGGAYRNRKPSGQVIILGTIVSLALFFISLTISIWIFHVNPIELAVNASKEAIKQIQAQMGAVVDGQRAAQPGQQQSLQQLLQTVPGLMRMIIPSSAILYSLLSAVANHAISRRVLKRMGTLIQPLPPLRDLRFPRSILYYYFIVLLMLAVPAISQYGFLHAVAVNVNLLMIFAFLLQALSLVAALFYRKGWSKALLVVVVLIFLLSPFAYILILVGMIDVGFNLRNRLFLK